MEKKTFQKFCEQVNVEGLMTFEKTENGLRVMDFSCCEDVENEPFVGNCKVQAMRDGNVYITELPKRARNMPLFREDNSSLSLGRNGKYYFCFSLPEARVGELPGELLRQARLIVNKLVSALQG